MSSLAEDSLGNLEAEDISIGEPLQIPLHSDRGKNSDNHNAQDPENLTTRASSQLSTPEKAATTTEKEVTKSPKESSEITNPDGEEPNDDQKAKAKQPEKKSSGIKKGPQGSGWLGLIVDDSIITGRLVIVKVSDPSPAMQVGIKAQDVLLAIDGEPVQTADQLAALLAAIPPIRKYVP